MKTQSTCFKEEALMALARIRSGETSDVREPATFLNFGVAPTKFCWPCGQTEPRPLVRTSDLMSEKGTDGHGRPTYRLHSPRVLCKACLDYFEVQRAGYAYMGVLQGTAKATEKLLLRGTELRKRPYANIV